MTDEVRLHWALHEHDAGLLVANAGLREHAAARGAWDAAVARAKAAIDAHDRQAAERAKERRALERDLETLEAEEKRSQGQLPAIKKNDEYQALQAQIAQVRAKRSDLETEILVRIEDDERRALERVALVETLAGHEAKRAEGAATLDREDAALRERIAGIEAQRAAVVAQLAAAAANRYERIRAARGGMAVAAVEKGACGGCYRSVPPHALQEARRRERLLVCDGCGRLLVMPPDDAAPA